MFRKAIAVCVVFSMLLLFGCNHSASISGDLIEVVEIDDVSLDEFTRGIFGEGGASDMVLALLGLSKETSLIPILERDLKANRSELRNESGSPMSEAEISECLQANKDALSFRVKSLRLKYLTTSGTGEKIVASSRILACYVKNVFSFWDDDMKWFLTSDRVLLHNHGTIAKNAQAPTVDKTLLAEDGLLYRAAFSGGMVIDPDYEGYGISCDRVHPYLIQEACSKQCVDAVEAAMEWKRSKYEGNSLHGLKDDFKMYCFGYSQGGTMSLTVHNYIERNNLAGRLHFKGSLCGDGSYDLCETYKFFLDDENGGIYYPCVIPIILRSYLHCYKDSYLKGYGISDFFTPEVCNAIRNGTDNEWELIDNKGYSTTDIDNKIAEALGIEAGWDKIPSDRILTAAARDLESDVAKAMMLAFAENSYVDPKKWKNGKGPEIPVLAVHFKADEICPYVNMSNLGKLPNVSEYEYSMPLLDTVLGALSSGLESFGWDENKIGEVKQVLFHSDGAPVKDAHYTGGILFFVMNIFIEKSYEKI